MDGELAAEYLARLQAIRYEPAGYVEALILSEAHGIHRPAEKALAIPRLGLLGHRGTGDGLRKWRTDGRQVSAMNAEVLDALDIAYDVPGDNVIVRGFDLSRLKAGETIRIGDLVFAATGAPHRPCATFERRTSAAKRQAIGHGRFRGTMLDAQGKGYIHVGDTVERIFVGQLALPLTAAANIRSKNEGVG